MELIKLGIAGTMESGDIMIRLEPRTEGGVVIHLESSVKQQFGKQIEAVIRSTVERFGIAHAEVFAVDKGALDCTVRARTLTALHRAADSTDYTWEVRK